MGAWSAADAAGLTNNVAWHSEHLLGISDHWPLMQVDPRLPEDQQQAARDRMSKMLKTQDVDAQRVTRVVAKAYHDVTRKKLLC